jgi:predicted cupin superfamily sugar epimerase
VTAEEIIEKLGLEAHPEGGYFTETWRDRPLLSARGSGTAIFYLLTRGQVSAWHRIDATEIWHYYAGAALEIQASLDGRSRTTYVLGPDLERGECPQVVIPPHVWQTARSLEAWTLVGCTVSPAFRFEGFELAPRGWQPGSRVHEDHRRD